MTNLKRWLDYPVTYAEQQALIARFAQQAKKPYQVPKILDAAVCVFIEYLRTGTRLYPDNPWTYTRCQEKYDKDWQLIVGGFAPGGLYVNLDGVSDYYGVGGLWKI